RYESTSNEERFLINPQGTDFEANRPEAKFGRAAQPGCLIRLFGGLIYCSCHVGGQNGNNRYDTNQPRNNTKSFYSQNRTQNVGHWRRRFHLWPLWTCHVEEF